jgi:hypothetical protein
MAFDDFAFFQLVLRTTVRALRFASFGDVEENAWVRIPFQHIRHRTVQWHVVRSNFDFFLGVVDQTHDALQFNIGYSMGYLHEIIDG